MYTSPREVSRSLRLARLCMSAMLLVALLLVPLAHVPVALAAPAVTVTPTSGLVTTETGGMATFTIRLTSEPTALVTITLSTDNLAEGSVSPASLVFNNANWNTPQTVTVTGVDDSTVDGNITYTIVTGPASSADSAYNGRAIVDVTVVNDDNDIASVPEKTFVYLPFVKR